FRARAPGRRRRDRFRHVLALEGEPVAPIAVRRDGSAAVFLAAVVEHGAGGVGDDRFSARVGDLHRVAGKGEEEVLDGPGIAKERMGQRAAEPAHLDAAGGEDQFLLADHVHLAQGSHLRGMTAQRSVYLPLYSAALLGYV